MKSNLTKSKNLSILARTGQIGHIYNKNHMPNCPYCKTIKIKAKSYKTLAFFRRQYPVENFWDGKNLAVGCGKCWYCRQRYAATWAKRCELETFAQEQAGNKNNWFITLTYENEPLHTKYLKKIVYNDVSKFLNKLRNKNRYYEKNKRLRIKIKYIWVSEFGDQTHRIHIHMLLWNFKLKDKEYWKPEGIYPTYWSDWLTNAWGLGIVQIGQISGSCAAYCFKYSAKNYLQKCQSTGIGKAFFDMYNNEVINEKCYQNRYFLKLERKRLNNDDEYLAWLQHELKIADYFGAQKKQNWKDKLEALKAKLDSYNSKMERPRELKKALPLK